MSKHNKTLILILIGIMVSAGIVYAEGPQGLRDADVTWTSERFNSETWPPYNISALAGNITELMIHSWTQTRTWAGFYGNITGTIVLADASNNTMYDWSDTDPNGKIYASRDPLVSWIDISCATVAELSIGEAQFSGTNETDRLGKYPMDSPNRTFVTAATDPLMDANQASFPDYPSIYVGPVEIDPSTCPSTSLHNENGSYIDYNKTDQNSGNDPEHFRELVLSDNDGDGDGLSIVYTTIIERDYLGFDGRTHDFELIVPEDGHGTDTVVTQYYFYVELE